MPKKPYNDKLLFFVNPGSGCKDISFEKLIGEHFNGSSLAYELYKLPDKIDKKEIASHIKKSSATRVIAVGGDGTVKLVAEALIGSNIALGILPAGSANGMAKELGIPNDLNEALDLVASGEIIKIHLTKIGDEICIHLADLGFNAYLVKRFDALAGRGMWGYAKATWHALINHKRMEVEIALEDEVVKSKAAMVAICNATKYGTGLKINPDGKLDDELFEVILVKDYSYLEIMKIWFTNLPFNPEKIEVFQTKELKITTKHKAHFQVDGEYLGKVNKVSASLLPATINVIIGPNADEIRS